MKKNLYFSLFILLSLAPILHAGGGDSFAGGMAGGMMGGMISGAMTRGSGRSARRAEERARVAEDKAETVQREQDRDRLENLRRDMDQKADSRAAGATGFMMNILLFAVILLFLLVVGLGVVLLKRKKE